MWARGPWCPEADQRGRTCTGDHFRVLRGSGPDFEMNFEFFQVQKVVWLLPLLLFTLALLFSRLFTVVGSVSSLVWIVWPGVTRVGFSSVSSSRGCFFFFYLSFFTLLYLILKGFVFCFGIDRVTECDQYRCFPIICSLLLRAAKSEWLCVKWKTTFVLGTQRKIFVRSLKRRAQFAFLFHLNLFWVSKRKYSKKVTMQSKY